MVRATVSERKLERVRPVCESDQLVTESNPEQRSRLHELFDEW